MNVFVKTENHGTLNLRAQPQKSGTIIDKIPYGTKLTAEKIDSEWAKVIYKNKEGYVMIKFLSSNESSFNKEDLQNIYNNLKETLALIEKILK